MKRMDMDEARGFVLPDSFELIMPIPNPALNPNWRGFWVDRDPTRLLARQAAKAAAHQAYVKAATDPPEWGSVAVRITVNWGPDRPPSTRWDTDNVGAGMKAALDGLVDAQVIAEDRFVWDWRVTAYLVTGRSMVHLAVHPETPHHTWAIEPLLDAEGEAKPTLAIKYPKGLGR